ncbi:MAG: hypothetical protein ABIH72_02575 [archaeon]
MKNKLIPLVFAGVLLASRVEAGELEKALQGIPLSNNQIEASSEINTLIITVDEYIGELSKKIVKVEEEGIKKEESTVRELSQQFFMVKRAVEKKDYYESSRLHEELSSRLNSFSPDYDSQVVSRVQGYQGISNLRDSVSSYKSQVIVPELKKIQELVDDFKKIAVSYEKDIKEENIDRLISYDQLLQKMSVLITQEPYSYNKALCSSVIDTREEVYSKLKQLAESRYQQYNDRIAVIGEELRYPNQSVRDLEDLQKELRGYRDLCVGYKDTLFSDRYLGRGLR